MTTIKKNKLTDDQYAVAREGATEPPFSGAYNYEKSCSHNEFKRCFK